METFECEAVLFDLDGVLVDSDEVVVRTWRNWAEARGIELERVLDVAHGRRTAETIRLVAPGLDADAEAAELEQVEIADLEGVLEIRGARELLLALAPEAWAVVTSGPRPVATRRMEYVGLPVPKHMVTSGDVENGKPHPEPYLRGAELLSVAPEGCVVVEDAPSGIRSARAAGMRVIAVATTYPGDEVSEADAVARSLAEIQVTEPSDHSSVDRPRFELRVESS